MSINLRLPAFIKLNANAGNKARGKTGLEGTAELIPVALIDMLAIGL